MKTGNSGTPKPTISAHLPDGALVEALHDPVAGETLLAVNGADGETRLVPYLDLPTGERLVPYPPGHNLLSTGCVRLPSAAGEFKDKAELFDAIERGEDIQPLLNDEEDDDDRALPGRLF